MAVVAVVAVAAFPVVFWLNVGQVNVPVLKLPDVGVPKIGVTSDGLVDKTTEPVPVEEVTPVPPLATGSVPLTCVAKPILPQLGADPTPPEIKALPTATSASLAREVVVSAYNKSPTA